VTTIVPALDGGERLVDLVRVLVEEGPVIVVDDGSRDGSGARAAAAGARVVRHDAPRGPAAARNAGLRVADTELVAFLDADCVARPGWRRGLAAMLDADRGAAAGECSVATATPADDRGAAPAERPGAMAIPVADRGAAPSERLGVTAMPAADRGLALVAPQVRSAPGDSVLARYEETASPLDLGPDGGLVGPDRRTAYVPAAAMVARREALLALGGFDESLRFGEDVDLVWRLLAAGHRVRYVPSREVHHAPRPTLAGMLRQRAGYGASAPDLVRRHGPAAAPLRVSPHALTVWAAALAPGVRLFAHIGGERTNTPAPGVRPLHDIDRQRTNTPFATAAGLTAAALAGSAALVARRGSDRDSRVALAGLALRGHATATRHLARALVREWLPLSLLAATRSRRARPLLLAAAAVDLLAARRPAGEPAAPVAERPKDRPGAAAAKRPLDRLVGAAGRHPTGGTGRLAAAVVLRPLDHAAYSAGLWRAAIARREAGALLPRLTARSNRS
jgi:mycofactocin glycosyltransferase